MKQGHVLAGKILIKQDSEERTASGIIIPDTVDKPKRGTVVLVGQSKPNVKMEITEGDKVLYAEHAGTPVVIDHEDFDRHGEFVLLDQTQVLYYK